MQFAGEQGQQKDDGERDERDVVEQGEGVQGEDGGGFFDGDKVGRGDKVVEKDETVAEKGEREIAQAGDKTAKDHNKDGEQDMSRCGPSEHEPLDKHDAEDAEPAECGEHGDVDQLQCDQADSDVADEEGGGNCEDGELSCGAPGNDDDAQQAHDRQCGDADAELSQHEGPGEAEVECGQACLVDEDAAKRGEAVGEDDGQDEAIARGRGDGRARARARRSGGGGNGGGLTVPRVRREKGCRRRGV